MPTHRVTTQNTHLSETEKAICLRVKEARQRLGLDQSEVVRRLGLKAHAISTIEKCRAPLRFDIALRFCRELLVNEQWLATGKFSTLEGEAKRRGVATTSAAKTGKISDLHPLFFRLACDLWSEDVTRTIPARTLYSHAFNQFLAPIYDELAARNFYFPRIKPNSHDTLDISVTIFRAIVDAGLILLANEALRRGVSPLQLQKQYLSDLLEKQMQVFRETLALPVSARRAASRE